jgi:hypothetical protein
MPALISDLYRESNSLRRAVPIIRLYHNAAGHRRARLPWMLQRVSDSGDPIQIGEYNP